MVTVLLFRIAPCILLMLSSQGASACEKGKSRRHWSENCSDGIAYVLGDENRKLFEACNVEPKLRSLSYLESIWTAYECIVRKGIGASLFDLKDYIDMMSTNLPESKRKRIRELVLQSNFVTNASLETGFAKLKSYRTEYFKAEFEACKYEGHQTKGLKQNVTNGTLKERWLEEWEPSVTCAEGKLPQFLVEYFPTYRMNALKACKSDLEKRYKIVEAHPLRRHIHDLCFCVSIGAISVQYLESENFSFDQIFYDVLPKYWSKVVKERGYAQMLKSISDWYSVDTKIHNVSGAVSVIRSKFQKKYANVTAGSDPKSSANHFAEKAYIAVALLEGGIEALGESCLPSGSVTDVSGSLIK